MYHSIARSDFDQWVILGAYNERRDAIKHAKRRHNATGQPAVVVYDAGTRKIVSAIYPYHAPNNEIATIRSLPGFENLTI